MALCYGRPGRSDTPRREQRKWPHHGWLSSSSSGRRGLPPPGDKLRAGQGGLGATSGGGGLPGTPSEGTSEGSSLSEPKTLPVPGGSPRTHGQEARAPPCFRHSPARVPTSATSNLTDVLRLSRCGEHSPGCGATVQSGADPREGDRQEHGERGASEDGRGRGLGAGRVGAWCPSSPHPRWVPFPPRWAPGSRQIPGHRPRVSTLSLEQRAAPTGLCDPGGTASLCRPGSVSSHGKRLDQTPGAVSGPQTVGFSGLEKKEKGPHRLPGPTRSQPSDSPPHPPHTHWPGTAGAEGSRGARVRCGQGGARARSVITGPRLGHRPSLLKAAPGHRLGQPKCVNSTHGVTSRRESLGTERKAFSVNRNVKDWCFHQRRRGGRPRRVLGTAS